jgi:hypothetical protein
MDTNPMPTDPAAELTTSYDALTVALTAWADRDNADPDRRQVARRAVPAAIEALDMLLIQGHRLRERIAREARRYDRKHGPYDDRD